MAVAQFGGYRLVPGYGWIGKITQEEYEQNECWEYADSDFDDLFIIAYNRDKDYYAYVEGTEQ